MALGAAIRRGGCELDSRKPRQAARTASGRLPARVTSADTCSHPLSRQVVGEGAALGQYLVEFTWAEGRGERGEQQDLGAGPGLFGWPGGLLVAHSIRSTGSVPLI